MFSIPKKNNSNKTTRLKCAETGNKPESANTEKNVSMLMEKTNSNKNKISLCITRPETANFSIKKVLVLTEPDVCSFMSTKIKWKNSDNLTEPDSLKNSNMELQKIENSPDLPLPKTILKQPSNNNKKNKKKLLRKFNNKIFK